MTPPHTLPKLLPHNSCDLHKPQSSGHHRHPTLKRFHCSAHSLPTDLKQTVQVKQSENYGVPVDWSAMAHVAERVASPARKLKELGLGRRSNNEETARDVDCQLTRNVLRLAAREPQRRWSVCRAGCAGGFQRESGGEHTAWLHQQQCQHAFPIFRASSWILYLYWAGIKQQTTLNIKSSGDPPESRSLGLRPASAFRGPSVTAGPLKFLQRWRKFLATCWHLTLSAEQGLRCLGQSVCHMN